MTGRLKKFFDINVAQFYGNKTLMEGGAVLLEMWVEAAEQGAFGDEYTPEDIERTRQRAADIRSICVGGSSEKAGLN